MSTELAPFQPLPEPRKAYQLKVDYEGLRLVYALLHHVATNGEWHTGDAIYDPAQYCTCEVWSQLAHRLAQKSLTLRDAYTISLKPHECWALMQALLLREEAGLQAHEHDLRTLAGDLQKHLTYYPTNNA